MLYTVKTGLCTNLKFSYCNDHYSFLKKTEKKRFFIRREQNFLFEKIQLILILFLNFLIESKQTWIIRLDY